ncbi:GDSL-like lipase/acylhydrolase family protein [Erwinia phage Faunus]|uniref:GDSL-like lipase/acylhydrolase family protein n=1 Tax=Erwinia phage Faunus TaxID=2182346 RepID=A0A2U8UWK6_9CAUD|nr:GDSL-like lipase/acylhydrolase family protein [Erwinia phage Faunus]AWN08641.1 GDSL-like lipase/acylhydrolase family protein [Erwinia phage Faunus]
MAEIFKDGDILFAKPLNDLADTVVESAAKVDTALVQVDSVKAQVVGIRTTLEEPDEIQELDSEGKLLAKFDSTGKKIFYGGVKSTTLEPGTTSYDDGVKVTTSKETDFYLGTELDLNGHMLWGTHPTSGKKIYLSRMLLNNPGAILGNGSAMGDSITANGYFAGSLNGLSWHMWASINTNSQFWIDGIYATGGYTSQQIRDNWLPLCIANGATFCVLMCGRNDVRLLPNDVMTTTVNNMTYMCNQLLLNGIIPVLCTMSAHGNSAEPEMRVAEHKLNNWIRAYARKEHLPLVDLHKVTVDPQTGDWLPGYNQDVSHPNTTGAKVMGKALSDVLSKWLMPGMQTVAEEQLYGPTNNVMPNPLMYDLNTDGNGPDGWTKTGTGTSTIGAEADSKGNVLSLTNCRFLRTIENLVPGTKMGFGMFAKMDSNFNISLYIKPGIDDSATTYITGITSWDKRIEDWSYVYREFTVPAGITRATVVIAAGGAGTLKVKQIGLFNLTKA